MPEEQALILHMHELLQYLNRQGASTFLTVAQHGLVGDMKAPVDVTYLADTVILLRYFEALGRVRRAISVIKKRTGAHEDTIREYRIDEQRHHARRAADWVPGRAARRARLVGRRAEAAGSQRRVMSQTLRTGADPGAAGPRRARSRATCWPKPGLRGDVVRRPCRAGRGARGRRRLRRGDRGGARPDATSMPCPTGSRPSPNGPTSRSSC